MRLPASSGSSPHSSCTPIGETEHSRGHARHYQRARPTDATSSRLGADPARHGFWRSLFGSRAVRRRRWEGLLAGRRGIGRSGCSTWICRQGRRGPRLRCGRPARLCRRGLRPGGGRGGGRGGRSRGGGRSGPRVDVRHESTCHVGVQEGPRARREAHGAVAGDGRCRDGDSLRPSVRTPGGECHLGPGRSGN